MNQSDMWRGTRHNDAAREIATVTHGVSDYLGTVANDRSYQVSWTPIAGYGQTDTRRKLVELNAELLDGMKAPFDGAFVDHLMGLSAHEAGHTILAPALEAMFAAGFPNTLLEGMVSNVLQDIAIDYTPMARMNPGIGQLTTGLRAGMAPEQRKAIAERWNDPKPLASAAELFELWGCAILFNCEDVLTNIPQRQPDMATIRKLNPIGLRLRNSTKPLDSLNLRNDVYNAINDVLVILTGWSPQAPLPSQGDGQGEQSGEQGEGSGEGQSTEGDGESGKGGGEGESTEGAGAEGGESGKGAEGTDGKAAEGGKGNKAAEGGEQGSSEAGGVSESASAGSGGQGAGGILKGGCPSMHQTAREKAAAKKSEKAAKQLWNEVKAELERLIAQSILDNGVRRAEAKRQLRGFTNDRIVGQVEKAWRQLASDPSRKRRVTQGRVDRRSIVLAEGRSDIFNSKQLAKLDGTLVLALDLSGSTQASEMLIKQSAASVYVALAQTDIGVYVYSYGHPAYVQLASPTKVGDFKAVHSSGGTPMAECLDAIVRDVPVKGTSVILNVTDGVAGPITAPMKAAKAAGWHVQHVMVGMDDTSMLEASMKAAGYRNPPKPITLGSYNQLPTVIQTVVQNIMKGDKHDR